MRPEFSALLRSVNVHRARWVAALGAMMALAVAIWVGFLWSAYNRLGALAPSGGLYFPKKVELAVPSFRQNDPRWGDDRLGATEDTLGGTGCAVSSVAMVLGFYGIDTDPQRLNAFLTQYNGYTPEGWIYWEAAPAIEPGRIRHVYEDQASYRLIDSNLAHGNPVIVRLRLPGGGTHFVVIAGKSGFDYLTRDPGAGASRGLYPLRELGSRIEGLRFYARIDP